MLCIKEIWNYGTYNHVFPLTVLLLWQLSNHSHTVMCCWWIILCTVLQWSHMSMIGPNGIVFSGHFLGSCLMTAVSVVYNQTSVAIFVSVVSRWSVQFRAGYLLVWELLWWDMPSEVHQMVSRSSKRCLWSVLSLLLLVCCDLCNRTSITLLSSVQFIRSRCGSRRCTELSQSFSRPSVRAVNGWPQCWCDKATPTWPASSDCSGPFHYWWVSVVATYFTMCVSL